MTESVARMLLFVVCLEFRDFQRGFDSQTTWGGGGGGQTLLLNGGWGDTVTWKADLWHHTVSRRREVYSVLAWRHMEMGLVLNVERTEQRLGSNETMTEWIRNCLSSRKWERHEKRFILRWDRPSKRRPEMSWDDDKGRRRRWWRTNVIVYRICHLPWFDNESTEINGIDGPFIVCWSWLLRYLVFNLQEQYCRWLLVGEIGWAEEEKTRERRGKARSSSSENLFLFWWTWNSFDGRLDLSTFS